MGKTTYFDYEKTVFYATLSRHPGTIFEAFQGVRPRITSFTLQPVILAKKGAIRNLAEKPLGRKQGGSWLKSKSAFGYFLTVGSTASEGR